LESLIAENPAFSKKKKKVFTGYEAVFLTQKTGSLKIMAQNKSLREGKNRPGGPKYLQGGSCPPTSRAYVVN